jgi:hypothetical protein
MRTGLYRSFHNLLRTKYETSTIPFLISFIEMSCRMKAERNGRTRTGLVPTSESVPVCTLPLPYLTLPYLIRILFILFSHASRP